MTNVDAEIAFLKDSTGDDFFKRLEKHIECVIPVNVKKILALNSYDNVKALSEFDTKSIEEIESFMRCDFKEEMIDDNETINDYFGIFSKSQQNFKILSGQCKLINNLADVCRKLCRRDRTQQEVRSVVEPETKSKVT